MPFRVWLASTLLAVALAAPASAQETRTQILVERRAEKAGELKPNHPTDFERLLLWVEETDPLSRIAPHNGFYVQYGYTSKPVGSGIAFGGGWRHDLLDRQARLVIEAGQSLRGYRMARVDLAFPRLLDDRLELGVEGAYRHHPQEDFYGLGPFSARGDRTSFRYRAPEVQGRAVVRPADTIEAGLRVGRMNVSVGPGTDSRFPSIEQRFTGDAAPGLDAQPDYRYTDIFAVLDSRDQPGNARAGAYVGATWRRYDDLDLDRFSFHQVDVEAQYFLPIFDKKRVIASRFLVMTTTAGDRHEVPFYMRPTVGGSDTLRSASDFRFRDRNAAVLNVEYRWEAFSGLDMALFTDFATVAPRFSDLEFADVKGAYGIGLRFNTYKAVFLRFDVAAGGPEGIRTFLKFSRAF